MNSNMFNKNKEVLFHAWQIDRNLRLSAVPLDRRTHDSQWYTSETTFPTGDDLIALFWFSSVPGSGAPEIPYVEMVQAMGNKGYDVSKAEEILWRGLALVEEIDLRHTHKITPELRIVTSELLHEIHNAPRIPDQSYWTFEHPLEWQAVREALPGKESDNNMSHQQKKTDIELRIYHGWLGQLAGGAFGTALEGYHGAQLEKVYGRIDSFVATPETVNDDVVYELAFLDAFERTGRAITSQDIGREWIRQIPFGWSAEWIALHNMADGILPPLSGSWHNPYLNWIGAQMRGMACGLVAPAWPMEAVRLAHIDGVVSHSENGVYGEMYAAALTSLAFAVSDLRMLLIEAARFVPQKSEYASVLRTCFDVVTRSASPDSAWDILDTHFERYNWIHAYPNIAAVVNALWFGSGDMTESFRILAHAGLDVDCNAGLVGTVLGIIDGVPPQWSAPIGDTLETYLLGKERLSIHALAARTAALAEH